jgi:hypothetical protein
MKNHIKLLTLIGIMALSLWSSYDLLAQDMNTLTPAEKAEGWTLLFDGVSTKGWRNFNKSTIGSSWIVENGVLALNAVPQDNGKLLAKDGGDIVTEEEYEDFELVLDWKISPCGNSGVMFLVKEDEKYTWPWQTGPEMQILDNTCHPDAKIIKHRAGDLYDIQSSSPETVKPAGEWNTSSIKLQDGHLTFHLNGVKVLETDLWTEKWPEILSQTKWKDHEDFTKFKKGRIALQDHRDARVEFRNMKIRRLN